MSKNKQGKKHIHILDGMSLYTRDKSPFYWGYLNVDGEIHKKSLKTKDKKEALKNILSGIIFMVGDELSGERMYVAWETMGQEDEHSCFSDMTHMDIVWNFKGVENILNQTQVLNLVDDSLAR